MKKVIILISISLILISCSYNYNELEITITQPSNVLNYVASPDSSTYRSSLAFSDQGAWFAYGFTNKEKYKLGFAGPFLMTQENGIWCSPSLSYLELCDDTNHKLEFSLIEQSSFLSHLMQSFKNKIIEVNQTLFFASPHSVVIRTTLKNISNNKIKIKAKWYGNLQSETLSFNEGSEGLRIQSTKSDAIGLVNWNDKNIFEVTTDSRNYSLESAKFEIEPNQIIDFKLSHTFIFPNYSLGTELASLNENYTNYHQKLASRILEKDNQISSIKNFNELSINNDEYKTLVSKCILTLQNNWRVPAGELKHNGLFPSYHYIWFHGFWAWDSWKHAVALSKFNIDIAKEQVRAMFDFQNEDGFVADCVYRDTTIENHNYRNTKPPLSAWAVWEIYKTDSDQSFIKEMYPKIVNQHNWWYEERDHDKDSLCEYGSTDGTLIAAKWESGMDNAVRFDDSNILKNSSNAFSLNQESVDLNSYLYAEKIILYKMAKELKIENDKKFLKDAEMLKKKIQNQFYDTSTGWFYDTSIDGYKYIEVIGCEGWIPLWANAATAEQASSVKNIIMDSDHFNTFVPLPTLSASNPKFNPDGGYWRGPNWLDQSYFGVRGLLNYGYKEEAKLLTEKLIKNAEGILGKGKSIRENYHPLTGEGLESESFSWSAAHYLMLLQEKYN